MIIRTNLTNTLYFLIIKLYKFINLYCIYSIHAHVHRERERERERDLCALCCYLVLGLTNICCYMVLEFANIFYCLILLI